MFPIITIIINQNMGLIKYSVFIATVAVASLGQKTFKVPL